jgi:hypothetical protein
MNSATSTDPGLRPWQLFLLAGMLAATAVVLVSTGQTMSSVVVLSATVVASSLVAVAGYRSLAPLAAAQDDAADAPVGGRARAALEREKALVLRTIKELEFDHAMGKTATAEFEDMRDRLKLRAVGLMRRLEGSDFRAAVERELAARTSPSARKAAPAAPPPMPTTHSDSLAAPVAAVPSTLARVCGGCGGVNDVDARFCKHCGASIAGAAS